MTTLEQYRENQRRWRSFPENREREKVRRNKAGEKKAAMGRRRDLSRWPAQVMNSIRFRSRRAGLECTVTAADIHVPEYCPVLGMKLAAGCEAPLDGHPSVDRFDNTRGYTPDNIRVISYRANQLKRNANIQEIRNLLEYMEGRR